LCQNHSYESSSAASSLFAFNDINSAGEVEDVVSQGAEKAFCEQSSLINIRDDQLQPMPTTSTESKQTKTLLFEPID